MEPVFPLTYADTLFGELPAVHSEAQLVRIVQGVLDDCLDYYIDASGRSFDLRITAVCLRAVDSEEEPTGGWVPDSVWDEHPMYPRADWQYEVANEDTVLGYIAWVNHQILVDAEAGD